VFFTTGCNKLNHLCVEQNSILTCHSKLPNFEQGSVLLCTKIDS